MGVETVTVVGRGPVGLIAALLLGNRGVDVTLIGPPPAGTDGRTVALMEAAIGLLKREGVWGDLGKRAAALEILRLVDDTDRLVRAPTVAFRAEEIGQSAFGHSVATVDLVAALEKKIATIDAITVIDGSVGHVEPTGGPPALYLEDANTDGISSEIVVAADGRLSRCREALGIATRVHRYPQTAVVFNIAHDKPHDFVSTEFHRPTGPFTLVPLTGNRCGIVAVESPEGAEALLDMDDAELARTVEKRSHFLVGTCSIEGRRHAYPLQRETAQTFAKDGVLLTGEAGHVMPPIGAQGLNLGIRDAAAAAGAILNGATAVDVMADYERSRRRDVALRMGAVDLLNRTLLSDLVPVQAVRALGLSALGRLGPLRRMVMREGMAPQSGLPELMRDAA